MTMKPYCILLLACLISANSNAENSLIPQPQTSQFIRQAQQLNLANHPVWQRLLHYQPYRFLPGVESLVETPAFFLAEQGKKNPQMELEASLFAFLNQTLDPKKDQMIRCQFIARFIWLREQLDADYNSFPTLNCPDYNEWLEAINPDKAVLIFPAAYLNNPSSMYGHTLLRIDQPGQTEKTRLHSYAINFAAQTDEANGVNFAIKGLTGLYPGAFSIMPYYVKVNDYSDVENRDIWEYHLNLSRSEINFLLAHLWELREVIFAYYFVYQNCSYQLLALLDAAKPELNLTAQFSTHAIPSDTLQILLEQDDILNKVTYRPSMVSRINSAQRLLSHSDNLFVKSLASGELKPNDAKVTALEDGREVLLLETAYDYLQYRQYRNGGSAKNTASIGLGILRQRSKIKVPALSQDESMPLSAPHLGHASARLGIAYGETNGQSFTKLNLRASYHDILDLQPGFASGAQINMLSFELYQDKNNSRLESIELVDILSLSPRNELFSPRSWRVNAAFRRLPTDDTKPELAFSLDLGYGLTYGDDKHLLYGLGELRLFIDDSLPNDLMYAPGTRFGAVYYPFESWAMAATLSTYKYSAPLDRQDTRLQLEQRFRLSDSQALRLNIGKEKRAENEFDDAMLTWHLYF